MRRAQPFAVFSTESCILPRPEDSPNLMASPRLRRTPQRLWLCHVVDVSRGRSRSELLRLRLGLPSRTFLTGRLSTSYLYLLHDSLEILIPAYLALTSMRRISDACVPLPPSPGAAATPSQAHPLVRRGDASSLTNYLQFPGGSSRPVLATDPGLSAGVARLRKAVCIAGLGDGSTAPPLSRVFCDRRAPDETQHARRAPSTPIPSRL